MDLDQQDNIDLAQSPSRRTRPAVRALIFLTLFACGTPVWVVACLYGYIASAGGPLGRHRPEPIWGVAAILVPVVVIGFVIARNVWQERGRVAAIRRLPTPDEFRARWVGATKDELAAVLGSPQVSKPWGDAGGQYWEYYRIVRDPIFDLAYPHVYVHLNRVGLIIEVECSY